MRAPDSPPIKGAKSVNGRTSSTNPLNLVGTYWVFSQPSFGKTFGDMVTVGYFKQRYKGLELMGSLEVIVMFDKSNDLSVPDEPMLRYAES